MAASCRSARRWTSPTTGACPSWWTRRSPSARSLSTRRRWVATTSSDRGRSGCWAPWAAAMCGLRRTIPTAFRPYFTPDVGTWSMPGAPAEEPTARSRAEFGTYNHPLVIGLGTAVGTLMDVGLDIIRDHVAGLSKTLREAMLDTPGVNVLTPMEPGKSAGVTTLSFDGYSDEDLHGLVAWLDAERNILVKSQWLSAPLRPGHSGMRISVAGLQHRGGDPAPGRTPCGRALAGRASSSPFSPGERRPGLRGSTESPSPFGELRGGSRSSTVEVEEGSSALAAPQTRDPARRATSRRAGSLPARPP